MDSVDDKYKYRGNSMLPMTKHVALPEEVYELLKSRKHAGETLSDVIRRSVTLLPIAPQRRKKLSDFAGLWKDVPDEEIQAMKDVIAQMRRGSTQHLLRKTRRM